MVFIRRRRCICFFPEFTEPWHLLNQPITSLAMPTFVHLADERDAEMIRKNGIKIRKGGGGVYCMPVIRNFYLSHQWLRELKRDGTRTIVGVYFKMTSSEMVYAGRYGQRHTHIPVGEAIKEIMSLEDPLGYELIVDRKIEAKEIVGIKHLPQTLGWRYMPDGHNKKPCACVYCLKGTIKGRRTLDRLDTPDIDW